MADGTGQFVDVQTEDYSVCDVKGWFEASICVFEFLYKIIHTVVH